MHPLSLFTGPLTVLLISSKSPQTPASLASALHLLVNAVRLYSHNTLRMEAMLGYLVNYLSGGNRRSELGKEEGGGVHFPLCGLCGVCLARHILVHVH